MSEEGGHESFLLWENQSWGLSNSNNNSAGSEEKSGKNHLQEQETLQDETKKIKKRGRTGGVGKNEKGSTGEVREGKEGGGGAGDSDHEMHIWTERERRKKMRDMFASLHALVPQLPPKVTLN